MGKRQDFFEHFYDYLLFNIDDIDCPEVVKSNKSMQSDRARKRYSTFYWERDRSFSVTVKKAYSYKCAICRCDIEEVLQAAHEHGYEPGIDNWDDPSHGICLCANHHLMYDANLLNIDFNSCSVSFMCDALKNAPVNKGFYETYDGKLMARVVE